MAGPTRLGKCSGRYDHRGMRIELHDQQRTKIGRIEVDPAIRPTRVAIVDQNKEVFLHWDTAVDDAGHLRRCVSCGCNDLYRSKAFPQVTGFVVVLAFAGAVLGAFGSALGPAWGFAITPPVLVAMVLVLVADVAILLFSKQRLVCYQCRTSFHDLPIARYHRRWDRTTAERFANISPDSADAVRRGAEADVPATTAMPSLATKTSRMPAAVRSARERRVT